VPAAAPAAATTPAAAAASEDQVVIEYVDADIQNVLRTLASRAGVNLILGDEVAGKVTVHLENIAYEEAMRLIVESKGYAFVKTKNIVKVKSREAVDLEPIELRVFTLRYAKAADIKGALDQVVSARGKVQVDARSNTLILSETPSRLTVLAPLIENLDAQTPQVMIEARFVETTRNPKKDLGFDWTDTFLGHQFSAGPFRVSKDLNGGPWMASTALLDAGSAKMVFSFMSKDSASELLANPRIVTADNGKAKIAIATQYPIPSFTFSEQTASLQISGFEYKDIGIILNVVPRINKDQFITLEVSPEASSSTESATLQSGGGSAVQIPIINTRTATTTVLIKSGNTLAIGGLMRVDVQDIYSKVPVIGDMPGLGTFFRSKSLNKTKRDLLIFLTPTIVGPEAQTGYEKYYSGLPNEPVYTNDKWQPKDNAEPRPFRFQDYIQPSPASSPAPAAAGSANQTP
jgi:type IV pilus assembly protein PilQ